MKEKVLLWTHAFTKCIQANLALLGQKVHKLGKMMITITILQFRWNNNSCEACFEVLRKKSGRLPRIISSFES